MRRLLVYAILVLLGSAGHAVAQNQKLVRLSYSGGWDAIPAIVAQERGFFAEEGLRVSGLSVTSATAVAQSIIVGTTDFALIPQRALLVMATTGLDFSIVSQGGWGMHMELVVRASDKGTKSLKDLKGKTIAVGSGSEALPVLVRLLNQAQMSPKDVNIRNVNLSNLVKAFNQPGIDAVFDTRHYTDRLVSEKVGRVVMSNEDVTNAIGRIGAVPLVANKAMVDEKPELVQKFVNAWVRGLAYIQKDPEDAARRLQIFLHRQGSKIEKEQALSWLSMINYDRYTWTEGDIADAEYNGWGLNTGGVLKDQPKVAGFVDNRFAEAAAKTLK